MDLITVLYIIFLTSFVLLLSYWIYYRRNYEGLDVSIPKSQYYTENKYNWVSYRSILDTYKKELNRMQTIHPIMWNKGTISYSSTDNGEPQITLSGSLPNIYMNIRYPFPQKGPTGSIGIQGDVGDDGLVGQQGEPGLRGYTYISK
jgi:hypothetical protein